MSRWSNRAFLNRASCLVVPSRCRPRRIGNTFYAFLCAKVDDKVRLASGLSLRSPIRRRIAVDGVLILRAIALTTLICSVIVCRTRKADACTGLCRSGLHASQGADCRLCTINGCHESKEKFLGILAGRKGRIALKLVIDLARLQLFTADVERTGQGAVSNSYHAVVLCHVDSAISRRRKRGDGKPMVPTTTAATAAVANLDFFIHTSLSMSGFFGCPLARKAQLWRKKSLTSVK